MCRKIPEFSDRTDVSYFTVLVLQCIHTPILDDTLNALLMLCAHRCHFNDGPST